MAQTLDSRPETLLGRAGTFGFLLGVLILVKRGLAGPHGLDMGQIAMLVGTLFAVGRGFRMLGAKQVAKAEDARAAVLTRALDRGEKID